ncbi:hypothetical protein ANO11243_031030 [Dothideomycetidae sp. 11243]|nr:hypothetical protein ANO11243_031030 [fungal sp. No.11243]
MRSLSSGPSASGTISPLYAASARVTLHRLYTRWGSAGSNGAWRHKVWLSRSRHASTAGARLRCAGRKAFSLRYRSQTTTDPQIMLAATSDDAVQPAEVLILLWSTGPWCETHRAEQQLPGRQAGKSQARLDFCQCGQVLANPSAANCAPMPRFCTNAAAGASRASRANRAASESQ